MWAVWFSEYSYRREEHIEAIFHTQDEAETALDACKSYYTNRPEWRWWVAYFEVGLPAYIKEKQ